LSAIEVIVGTPSAHARKTQKKGRAEKHQVAHAPSTAEPPDLAIFRDGEFAPELVVLPRGEFVMGSADTDREAYDTEKPQRRVRIDHWVAVGRYPVTFEEYDYFCDQTERERPNDEGWGRGRRPVINVSWEDAAIYCKWLGGITIQSYRLPSEAEWEYTCRASTTTRYAFGDELTFEQANFYGSVGKTVQVGSYSANAWGFYDMHGNVWEWLEDCWNETYNGAPDDGSAWTSGDCSRRVVRGGSWIIDPASPRSALRFKCSPDDRVDNCGFRVVRTLTS
jgi:formylglycine-generating enzyme required for sulfatase activity